MDVRDITVPSAAAFPLVAHDWLTTPSVPYSADLARHADTAGDA